MNTYNICIVGAGVVGCAIARELGRRRWDKPLRIIVLERNQAAGMETSGRNSGVLHSGIHENPHSLKARLAHEGSALAVSYATERGIPLLNTGMIIAIAWEDIRRGLWKEAASLRRLWFNAWKTGTRVRFVTSSGLHTWEPNLRACCGIVIPSISVIDPQAFVQSLKADSEETGSVFAFNNPVRNIQNNGRAYIISTDRQTIRATCLINAAGLYSDHIANLACHSKLYTIQPIRGEYYEVVPLEKRALVRRLIYPALPPQATGKGIHFSPRPDGRLLIGPNEVAVTDKMDYTSNKTPPGLFLETARKFLPELEEQDLRWAYAGIRPCVVAADGSKRDFIVSTDRTEPPLVNLVGIESPGLSASLALARHVVDLPCIQQRFRL
ncbi:MAG: NAD(P)/FAD-dependent oxidoreductase [Nitrospira sp.]|nr:NAD(P)/FAD-dependent oxidoreductase [Nitrospira sp.]